MADVPRFPLPRLSVEEHLTPEQIEGCREDVYRQYGFKRGEELESLSAVGRMTERLAFATVWNDEMQKLAYRLRWRRSKAHV